MRGIRFLAQSFLTFVLLSVPAGAQMAKKPKLVLTIVVDQFRYDYLNRFRAGYNGGIEDLLTKGAVFTDARYIHFPTVTAVGHSTVLSGALPSQSGIIGNEWFDRETKTEVTSVMDTKVKALGTTGVSSSPSRMQVSTVGDEMRVVLPQTQVIGISLKDRGAILPVGRMANGAYWFDNATGAFVSSSYYFPDLPAWVKDFNAGKPADKYAGTEWMGTKYEPAGGKLYASLAASPWGNELIEAFAEQAIQSESLGQRGITDLLSVSFSANDYVGHNVGPDDYAVQDMAFRTDLLLKKFFAFLDKQVGMKNVLVIFTADHGVAPVPEVSVGRKMPGGRLGEKAVEKTVQAALEKQFGIGNWVVDFKEGQLFLDSDLIKERGIGHKAIDTAAAEALRALPHVTRVYTREQLMNGQVYGDAVGSRIANAFYPPRSADLFIVLEPFWLFGGGTKGTSHGTAYGYDTHVPVIFMGAGIKPGKYYGPIAVNDIAPTLAAMLGIETPSGSVGRVLAEMFTKDLN